MVVNAQKFGANATNVKHWAFREGLVEMGVRKHTHPPQGRLVRHFEEMIPDSGRRELLEFAPRLSRMLQERTVDECRQDLRITKDYSPLDLSVVARQNDWLSRAII